MYKVVIVVGDLVAEMLLATEWDEVESIGHAAQAVARLCSGCELHVWVGDSDDLASFLDIDDRDVRMIDIESGELLADVERRITSI
jgi:hypothetical protein